MASPTESGHEGRASIVALETPPDMDVNMSRQLQDSSPQHEEATPLSTEMLGFLSNLSPFPHIDAPHLSPVGLGEQMQHCGFIPIIPVHLNIRGTEEEVDITHDDVAG